MAVEENSSPDDRDAWAPIFITYATPTQNEHILCQIETAFARTTAMLTGETCLDIASFRANEAHATLLVTV